jgi:hypothetical protein
MSECGYKFLILQLTKLNGLVEVNALSFTATAMVNGHYATFSMISALFLCKNW